MRLFTWIYTAERKRRAGEPTGRGRRKFTFGIKIFSQVTQPSKADTPFSYQLWALQAGTLQGVAGVKGERRGRGWSLFAPQ